MLFFYVGTNIEVFFLYGEFANSYPNNENSYNVVHLE